MNVISLLMVGMSSGARAVAVEASWLAFPVATLTDVPTVEEALKREPAMGPELLLLCEPDRAVLTQAAAATDALGLRRWMVVVFGKVSAEEPGLAAVVPPEDWKARLVAPVLRSAARLLALERENARLHGDLLTLSRRISHDLRTPLAAIYNACDAINESAADGADGQAAFTQAITASTDELVQLLERVTFILKASAEPNPKDVVVVSEIIFSTLQRLERSILSKGASVVQPPAWPVVRGVATWHEIVWFNLLANALRHAGGSPRIELGWSEAQGQFRFWVDDRGPGVAPDKVGRLFQPFHQLHRLNAPRGLGLALVQRLVELQGGRCGYETLSGGGAHFFFTLPAADPP